MYRIKIFFAILTALAFIACKKQAAPQQEQQAPVVMISAVATENLSNTNSYLGKIDAGSKATITARVSGYLENRLVNEGDIVKKGQLLFTIEKKQYNSAVKQAEAALAQARANAQNAALQKKRSEELIKAGSIPQASYDNAAAADAVAQANVAAASAALDAAVLNFQYTDIISPVSGKIGFINFNLGETVGPSAGPITTVIANEPMYAVFYISEKQLQELKLEYGVNSSEALTEAVKKNAALKLILSNGSTYQHSGTINFTDNVINTGSDSIRIRGIFPNVNGELTQGQTVTVNLVNKTEKNYVVIPSSSIMNDLKGKFVFIVTPVDEKTVVMRRDIKAGTALPGGRQIITDGLTGGEDLIIDGLQKARAGAAVTAMTPEQYGEFMKNMAAKMAGGH